MACYVSKHGAETRQQETKQELDSWETFNLTENQMQVPQSPSGPFEQDSDENEKLMKQITVPRLLHYPLTRDTVAGLLPIRWLLG